MGLSRAEMEHRIAAQRRKQASSGGQRRPAPAREDIPAAPAPTMQMQPMPKAPASFANRVGFSGLDTSGGSVNQDAMRATSQRMMDAMQRSAPMNPREVGAPPMADKMLRMGPSGAPPPRDQLDYKSPAPDMSAMAGVLSGQPRRGLGNYGLGGDVGPGVHNTLLGFQKRRMGGY